MRKQRLGTAARPRSAGSRPLNGKYPCAQRAGASASTDASTPAAAAIACELAVPPEQSGGVPYRLGIGFTVT